MINTRTKWIASIAAVVLVASTAACAGPANDSRGTVIRVIDGDTVDVEIAGTEQRVRLLNIDTPETVDPDKEVECLGPEASEYLKNLLAPGDQVKLEYDIERTDHYGRTLAGVFKNDSLVNADIAAAGLGIAVKYEPNVKFYDEVLAAQQKASANATGLFSADISCTLPAQFNEAYDALDQVPEEMSDSIAESESLAGEAAAAIAVGSGLKSILKKITPDSSPVSHTLLTTRFSSSVKQLDQSIDKANKLQEAHKEQHEKLIKADKERKEAERKKKEAAEKLKKEQERQKAVAEQRRIQQQKLKQQKQQVKPEQNVQRPKTQKPRTQPKQQAPRQKKAPENYTGPRCYAPGGKTWRPC